MKKTIFLILLIAVFILTALISFVYFKNKDQKINIVAPVPDYLNTTKNKEVSTLSLWIPILANFIQNKSNAPQISAKSAIVYDVTSDKVLYKKNSKERLPMASITKIMTAIIALENKKADDKYIVSKEDLVGENSMGLSEGEILSQKELLYGLLLPSGNDAAETFATNFKGGRIAFIKAMNDKARALGLLDTNFTNPSGLEGDGEQYTTAYDLIIITQYALAKFSLFRDIVSTFEYEIPYSLDHKYFFLQNETNLLTSYPGVKGVKDGYTPEAGLCLVTYLDYSGHKIIGIILGSNNRRQEMKDLLDYSLKSINISPPTHS